MTTAPVTEPLFGEQGRRRTAVHWGVQHAGLPGAFPAGVSPCTDREHAEAVAHSARAHYDRDAAVVCQTVTTYTTAWSRP